MAPVLETRYNVWIVGALGRMGQALRRHLHAGPYNIFATDREVDITDLETVNEYAETCRPHIIINCADYHEGRHDAGYDEITAYKINALGPRNLAIVSEEQECSLIHLSTDDIYLGSHGRKFNEFDNAEPNDVFGKSKYAGEKFVRTLTPRHLIIRSQWIYSALPTDRLHQMKEDALAGRKIAVAVNQIASPTSVLTLARFIEVAIENGQYGTFNASCEGICSRYEFYKRALELMGLPTDKLVGTHDPANAYTIELDNLMMRLTGIFTMPHWEDDLDQYLTVHGLKA